MQVYRIYYGYNAISCGKSLDVQELENELFEMDRELYITTDEAEALKEFEKYRSDCIIQKTPAGYTAMLNVYEMHIEKGEEIDGEFDGELIDIMQAPFTINHYVYGG